MMIRFFAALLLTLLFSGCQQAPQSSPQTTAEVGQQTPQAGTPTSTPLAHIARPDMGLVPNLNEFSRRMYLEVARAQKGNLAVSPLGSFTLLSLLYEGSAGTAKEAIADTTGFTPESLGQMTELVRTLEALPSLSTAQKIYIDDKARLRADYLEKVSALLTDAVQPVSFSRDPAAVTNSINAWVEDRTGGLIKNFLPQLPPDTVSVLVSCLHFKGQWVTEFRESETMPGEFTTPEGEKIWVSMMRMHKKDVSLFKMEGSKGLLLPFRDGTEMVLLLPEEGKTPDQLMSTLDLGALKRDLAVADEKTEVTIALPRFEFEVDTFALTQAWAAMGLGSLLSNPDLSPMLEAPVPVDLEIFHKTFVKVDEKGAEAAAATAVVQVKREVLRKPKTVSIHFDRPFLFALRDGQSGAIFMLGRVEQPELKELPGGNRSRKERRSRR